MVTIDDCWKVIRTKEINQLEHETLRINEYESASKQEIQSPAVRKDNWPAKLALLALQAHMQNKCRCSIYTRADNLNITHEIKFNFVDIIEKKVDRENWITEYTCRCLNCNTLWLAKLNDAGHSPTTTWSKID